MHYDVSIVHQHPASFRVTLDVFLSQPLFLPIDYQTVGNGFDVGVRSSAADNEVVGYECAALQVDDLDAVRFLFRKDCPDYCQFLLSLYAVSLLMHGQTRC